MPRRIRSGTALASTPRRAVEGLFDGLDESGALRLRLADGSQHVIHAGDVFLDLGPGTMLLAIDAGNTNIVFALLEGGEIRARWRIATDPRRTADEYAVWLHQLLEMEGLTRERDRRGDHRHGRAARAPQSPGARDQIFRGRGAGRRAGRRPSAASNWTWPNRATVGADRALNAIAAHALHPGDLIVIDFGTATTFDVVDYSRRL